MITYLWGKVIKNNISKISYTDILINNSIGYRVYVPNKFSFKEKGSDIEIYTSFQVREDSQTIYGFNIEKERDFFEQLLTVSGIGPKSALSILSTYTLDEIEKIVLEGDSKLLSKVSGLGSKGAQKVILELRGKIDFNKEDEVNTSNERLKELKSALKSLGFSGEYLNECIEKGEKVLKKKEYDIEELIKYVLSNDTN